MKRMFGLFLLAMFCVLSINAQPIPLNFKAKILKGGGKGNYCKVVGVEHRIKVALPGSKDLVDEYYMLYLNPKDTLKQEAELITNKLENNYEFQPQTMQELWDVAQLCHVFNELGFRGMQSSLRREMETDALRVMGKIRESGLEFHDPYVESYIYGLIAKIAPKTYLDARPYDLNLMIVMDDEMNASTYPNGTMILNTGLLSGLHTEDELVAILAHEIAHFVLDHSIYNVNKMKDRKENEIFWTSILTGLTAFADVALAVNTDCYMPGFATLGMAAFSSVVGEEIVEYLGMKYNHEQELEADRYACDVLRLLGYDENALATALTRIRNHYDRERDVSLYLNSETHPDLLTRLAYCGNPQQVKDVKFERCISTVVTCTARLKYSYRSRFRQCIELVDQNILNHVADVDDYILKSRCLIALEDTPESNAEALSLVARAKELEPDNINIFKSEIIASLRLGMNDQARELLLTYIQRLKAMDDSLVGGTTQIFTMKELRWARQMLVKLQVV